RSRAVCCCGGDPWRAAPRPPRPAAAAPAPAPAARRCPCAARHARLPTRRCGRLLCSCHYATPVPQVRRDSPSLVTRPVGMERATCPARSLLVLLPRRARQAFVAMAPAPGLRQLQLAEGRVLGVMLPRLAALEVLRVDLGDLHAAVAHEPR